jgi:hypothetical protein
MSSANQDFERLMLKQIRPKVVKHISSEARKGMWTYPCDMRRERGASCQWEFSIPSCKQFPEGVYDYNISAETAWGARAVGWGHLLDSMGVETCE